MIDVLPQTSNDRGEVVMSHYLEYPTCFACRSIDLEMIDHESFGPMLMCDECGYSWTADERAIVSEISQTVVKLEVA